MIYVYLDKNNNRLVISHHKIDEYELYFTTKCEDRNVEETVAKTYCAGFLLGTQSNIKLINDFSEFDMSHEK